MNFGSYDCIWAGSVFTHLSEAYTRETLQLLLALLSPRGVLVFTTHGEEALRRTLVPGWFGATIHGRRDTIRADFEGRGFHFTPYTRDELGLLPFRFRRGEDFGVTWVSEAYVRGLVERLSAGRLCVTGFRPAGWDKYQDVFFCQAP